MKRKIRPSISTGTGDRGKTSLFMGGRVNKHSEQISATGDCDELMAAIGMARAMSSASAAEKLFKIQQDLIVLMGDISMNREKVVRKEYLFKNSPVKRLERDGRKLEEQLPPLKGWHFPGNDPASSAIHFARTVARRCERSCLMVEEKNRASKNALLFLNRLSDYLWLLARKEELYHTHD